MGRDGWFRDKVEKVQTALIMLALLLATLALIYFTVPKSYEFTSLLAFAISLFVSAGLAQLATRSRWRSKSLIVGVVLLHVAVILGVPFLSLIAFPGWQASAGPFQSIPYAVFQGFMLGLFLLIFNSIARLCVRWWSSLRGGG